MTGSDVSRELLEAVCQGRGFRGFWGAGILVFWAGKGAYTHRLQPITHFPESDALSMHNSMKFIENVFPIALR